MCLWVWTRLEPLSTAVGVAYDNLAAVSLAPYFAIVPGSELATRRLDGCDRLEGWRFFEQFVLHDVPATANEAELIPLRHTQR